MKFINKTILYFLVVSMVLTIIPSTVMAAKIQLTPLKMEYETIAFEAEDVIYESSAEIVNDNSAYGGKALLLKGTDVNAIENLTKGHQCTVSFEVKTTAYYDVYFRYRTSSQIDLKVIYDNYGKSNIHYGTSENTKVGIIGYPTYSWGRLCTFHGVPYTAGKHDLSFSFSKDVYLDRIIITSKLGGSDIKVFDNDQYGENFNSGGSSYNYTSPFFSTDPIVAFPQKGVHPRLLLTEADIPSIKEKIKVGAFFEDEYKKLLADAETAISQNTTSYSESLMDRFINKAFVYVIGDKDDAFARETINSLMRILSKIAFGDDPTFDSRRRGHTIFASAVIYDWCYDLLTSSEKTFIMNKMKEMAAGQSVGFPASKRQFVTSQPFETMIFRDQLSMGIAVYDEDPDCYNTIASIICGKMTPSKNFFNDSGNDWSGSSYVEGRNINAMMAEEMFEKLGNDTSVFSSNYNMVIRRLLYNILPNGANFKSGDEYIWDRYIPDTKTPLFRGLFAYAGGKYNDPYIARQGLLELKWGTVGASVFEIISTDIEAETKDLTELPLTMFTTYPMSSMTARTSWQNGLNAPTAMATVEMREVTVGDHQHRDIGSFQLWYKGMLALDAGVYNSGSTTHHSNYYKTSTAHNTVLVCDPSETTTEGKDGGQKPATSALGEYHANLTTVNNKIASGECITSRDVSTYMGPESYKPTFSYISGEISDAYTDKVAGFVRSSVFVNLDDETYPAAFIVYDNISSSDASFKKKWLIHSENEPSVDETENTIVITRTDNGQNGKLVNRTLIPEVNSAEFTKVGGSGYEFYVNGTNYPPGNSFVGCQTDMGAWRVELSPKTEALDDVFLNIMYLTDADNTESVLPSYKESGSGYVGATIMDKTVLFPSGRSQIETSFSINIQDRGYDSVDVLLTGLKAGKWQIAGKVLESVAGENCISLTVAPGTYTVSPVSESSVLSTITLPQQEKEDFGDFLIKKGTNYMYLPKPTKLVDGVPYVAVDGIFSQLGAKNITSNAESLTFTSPNGETVTIWPDSNRYQVNQTEQALRNTVLYIDGEYYAVISDFTSVLNCSGTTYKPFVRLLKITM